MKTFTIALVLAALILPVEAKITKKQRDANRKRIQQQEQQEKKEKAERDRKRDAIDTYLAKKDKNSDGMVTRDEHLAGESDKEGAGRKFDKANKNRDRSLTKSEIAEMLGL